jgi:hypothetical protein
VADRFHLLQNVAAVLTQVFTAHASQLASVHAERAAVPTPIHDPAFLVAPLERPAVPLAPQQPSTAAARWARQRRTRRWAPYLLRLALIERPARNRASFLAQND